MLWLTTRVLPSPAAYLLRTAGKPFRIRPPAFFLFCPVSCTTSTESSANSRKVSFFIAPQISKLVESCHETDRHHSTVETAKTPFADLLVVLHRNLPVKLSSSSDNRWFRNCPSVNQAKKALVNVKSFWF